MQDGPLCVEVLRVIDAFVASVPPTGPVRDQVDRLRERLQQPLRVAIAGSVSSGKSTLVNALLGTVIAPTGAGETTRLLTWFHGGDVERAELHLKDGSIRRFTLTEDGRVPDELPLPIEAVETVHITVPTAALLRSLTLVDTPGLYSLRDDNSARTRTALGGTDLPEVDAVLFLLNGQLTEAETIGAFTRQTATLGAGAANVVAVLNKIDEVGEDGDPRAYGARKAARLAAEPALRHNLATVLPLVGLLAEAGRAGRFGWAQCDALCRLAADPTVDELLVSVDDLLDEMATTTTRAERVDLLDVLGLWGIAELVTAVRAGTTSAAGLRPVLLDRSGFAALEDAMHQHFVPRADALKADHALTALERLTFQLGPTTGPRLRSRLEEVRLRPAAHALRELHAVRLLAAAGDEVPDWLKDELVRVVTARDAASRVGLPVGSRDPDVRAAAAVCAARLQSYANRPLVSQLAADVAEVLRTSYMQAAGAPPQAMVREAAHERA